MRKAARTFGTVTLMLMMASCGGGGGGGGGGLPLAGLGAGTAPTPPTETGPGSVPAGSEDGSWLKLPSSLDFTIHPSALPKYRFSIIAQSTKTFEQKISVAIIDAAGSILPQVEVKGGGLVYSATMQVRPDLPPGVHTGKFEVRLCFDADPLLCSQPVGGSPWFVPYTFRIVDGGKYSFPAWERAARSAGYLNDYALSQLNSKLVVVEAAFYDGFIKTWTSIDVGASWQQMQIAGPTGHVRDFALASDGGSVYFSGGEAIAPYSKPTGGYSADVWKFDGTSWQARASGAPFGGRSKHVMAKVEGNLYVVGGSNGAATLRDVWKSSNDGVSWTKSSSDVPESVGRVTCALEWKGMLLVIGDRIATSSDGTNWTAYDDLPPTFPKGSTQCGVLAGRLFINPTTIVPYDTNIVSTLNLTDWNVERPLSGATFHVPGMAAVDGRLVVLAGTGTSERSTYRTVPTP